MQTGENEDVRPLGLLGGGEHFAVGSMPLSARLLFTRVWAEVSGGGSSLASSCECIDGDYIKHQEWDDDE